MSNSPSTDFVRYALRIGAIELVPGGRPLKSGRISPYFFNLSRFNSGAHLNVLARRYADAVLTGPNFDLIYGPAYKGTYLAPLVLARLAQIDMGDCDIRFSSTRKEPKGHGEGGIWIGSQINNGDRVLIVDDVITDGGTKQEAVELTRSCCGTPVALVIAFDRQEKGTTDLSASQEFSQNFGIPVISIATLDDLIYVLNEERLLISKQVLAYREKYGAT